MLALPKVIIALYTLVTNDLLQSEQWKSLLSASSSWESSSADTGAAAAFSLAGTRAMPCILCWWSCSEAYVLTVFEQTPQR